MEGGREGRKGACYAQIIVSFPVSIPTAAAPKVDVMRENTPVGGDLHLGADIDGGNLVLDGDGYGASVVRMTITWAYVRASFVYIFQDTQSYYIYIYIKIYTA